MHRIKMSTYTQILYQIVFSTALRIPALNKEHRPKLFQYINGVLRNKSCHVYRINGVEDHLHILTDIHPTVSLSDLIKDIKLSTTDMIKSERIFPLFDGWQEGYGAFTYSINEKDSLIEYIKNQEIHHKKISFADEYRNLLKQFEIKFNEKYLID